MKKYYCNRCQYSYMHTEICPHCNNGYTHSVEYVNCTPHNINFAYADEVIIIKPLMKTGRIELKEVQKNDTIFINTVAIGNIDLPEKKVGKIYIVSLPTLIALKAKGIYRDDIVAPNSDNATRNGEGDIISVENFIRIGE